MNVAVLEQKLRGQGFGHTYVWQDGADQHYSEHTHAVETAHIILEGEMTLTIEGTSVTYRAGDRCDVAAGVPHEARIGPKGCRYLIGEKQKKQ